MNEQPSIEVSEVEAGESTYRRDGRMVKVKATWPKDDPRETPLVPEVTVRITSKRETYTGRTAIDQRPNWSEPTMTIENENPGYQLTLTYAQWPVVQKLVEACWAKWKEAYGDAR
jgi:hypothetical protein